MSEAVNNEVTLQELREVIEAALNSNDEENQWLTDALEKLQEAEELREELTQFLRQKAEATMPKKDFEDFTKSPNSAGMVKAAFGSWVRGRGRRKSR